MKKNEKKGNGVIHSDTIVVGVGASAGGLEALQDFFVNMPLDTGLSFVVIQHLSPDYKSLMDELLARKTSIPIQIVKDGMEVRPNNIYLLPPRKNISIFHNRLYLEDQSPKKGLNLPVDIFFRSLAKEKGKDAIGVILSGTGSDGTLGTRAIKEMGGMIMVQDEQTAKFDGMPKSSISTGLVDYVLEPSKMPKALIDYVRHPFVEKGKTFDKVLAQNVDTLTKIILTLRDYSSIDFSYYKENTILRRIERRVSINRLDSLEDYLSLLSESEKEKETLNRELLIGVTRFFRDMDAFESLRKKVLPNLCKKNTVRVWSTGCSTGEEVYSLAILISEYLDQNGLNCDVKIFATDIDRNSVDFAGKGYYPDSVISDVDSIYLTKYFQRLENGYQVKDNIRKMIVFATHNLLRDSPFSKLDLLVCRNLFIYLKSDIQAKLLSMFYYSLNANGYMFLGNSETIGGMGDAFECLDTRWKIYKCKPGYKPHLMKNIPLLRTTNYDLAKKLPQRNHFGEGLKFDKLQDNILRQFLPPSVIIDSNDNILHIINDVSRFLKHQPGQFSQNLFSSLQQDLGLFVSTLIRKLKKEEKKVKIDNLVSLKGFKGYKVSLEGNVLTHYGSSYYIISFTLTDLKKNESKDPAGNQADIDGHYYVRIDELEKELQFTKENLQATVEELETSNEELQSSNEELIASNEELQSTNEELQSVNEELYTVNSEYQSKIEELTRLNNDMNNLLKNTEVGALYLDRNLCIRKITPVVSKFTNIRESDIGRPITHISVMETENTIVEDVVKVVDSLQPIDKELTCKDGITYLTRIRPYRSEYNSVDGILITFVDISSLKKEYKRADIATKRLLNALKAGQMAWWEWDITTNKVIYDDRKATMLGYTPEEFPDDVYKICELIHPEDYDFTMKSMTDYLEGKTDIWDLTYRLKKKDGSYAWYYDRGSITERDVEGKPLVLMGTVIDVSRMKVMEAEIKNRTVILEKILENSPVAKTMVDREGRIIYANKKAEKLFGISRKEITNRNYDSKNWKITGLDGKPLKSEQLPFNVIKKTGKEITDFKHYIQKGNEKRILLTINGTPIFNIKQSFDGAVFAIGVCNEQK